jgi:mannose-6-phosphate isomerase-like protein (cupin superfamily)
MELIKENEKGKTYKADDFKILYRNAGSVAGDNEINPNEIIYFITGKAKITLKEKTWEISSPQKVEFPAKTYHKIEAITDISFILFEK